jgi:hypothetical protein
MNDSVRYVNAVGIISDGCKECGELKSRLTSDFANRKISISFIEVVYEHDPDEASKLAEAYGLDDLPSFFVSGIVFKKGYEEKDVDRAAKKIR